MPEIGDVIVYPAGAASAAKRRPPFWYAVTSSASGVGCELGVGAAVTTNVGVGLIAGVNEGVVVGRVTAAVVGEGAGAAVPTTLLMISRPNSKTAAST